MVNIITVCLLSLGLLSCVRTDAFWEHEYYRLHRENEKLRVAIQTLSSLKIETNTLPKNIEVKDETFYRCP